MSRSLTFATVVNHVAKPGCNLLRDFLTADTFKMPSASISNVISNCGTPRGMGGRSFRNVFNQQVVVVSPLLNSKYLM
ncbi:hypothetical protein Plhal304r1_c086g0169321 [Plasmopara halstedii]